MSDDNAPGVVRPVRNQLSLQPMDLEALVPEDHPARGIWALVERWTFRRSTTRSRREVTRPGDLRRTRLCCSGCGCSRTRKAWGALGYWRSYAIGTRRTAGSAAECGTPREYLVDGGFVTLENIQVVSDRGSTPYAPVPMPRKAGVDPHAPKEGDMLEVAAWRRRMGTKAAKRIYVQRGVLAERTNADLRVHRGLDRLNVRGLEKVKTVVLLAALSFNLLRLVGTGQLL